MRLLIIPFIFVAMLVQVPISAQDISNQEAAEKIADAIGESFPDAAVDVRYQGGEVWLAGETVSPDQRKQIVEQVFKTTGIRVEEVNDEMQIIAPKPVVDTTVPVAKPAVPAARPTISAATAPVPIPRTPAPVVSPAAPLTARRVMGARQSQAQQAMSDVVMAPYPYAQYPAAYGMAPGQPSVMSAPFAPQQYAVPPQAAQQQAAQQYGHHYQQQPAYYGPPAGAAHHPEAYGQQGPLPGRYNQPNLPQHAWPAYASYPNYAQVSYPRMYSPKAWPYIGPFYPYPQTPLGWRKVTLENHNGWWWLDFDDGAPSGPFSGLFRQPAQYTY